MPVVLLFRYIDSSVIFCPAKVDPSPKQVHSVHPNLLTDPSSMFTKVHRFGMGIASRFLVHDAKYMNGRNCCGDISHLLHRMAIFPSAAVASLVKPVRKGYGIQYYQSRTCHQDLHGSGTSKAISNIYNI